MEVTLCFCEGCPKQTCICFTSTQSTLKSIVNTQLCSHFIPIDEKPPAFCCTDRVGMEKIGFCSLSEPQVVIGSTSRIREFLLAHCLRGKILASFSRLIGVECRALRNGENHIQKRTSSVFPNRLFSYSLSEKKHPMYLNLSSLICDRPKYIDLCSQFVSSSCQLLAKCFWHFQSVVVLIENKLYCA